MYALRIARFLGIYTEVSLPGHFMILRVHSNPDNEPDGERRLYQHNDCF